MDGCIRDMKLKMRDVVAKLRLDVMEHSLVTSLFVERKDMLQRVVDAFDLVCKKRNLNVNVNKKG